MLLNLYTTEKVCKIQILTQYKEICLENISKKKLKIPKNIHVILYFYEIYEIVAVCILVLVTVFFTLE